MKNNLLPIIKKNNIFTKIKDYLVKCFIKKENSLEENTNENIENKIRKKNEFDEKIKLSPDILKQIQNKQELRNIISQLDNDFSIIENLSLEQLKAVDDYYDELIKNKKIELKRLTSN